MIYKMSSMYTSRNRTYRKKRNYKKKVYTKPASEKLVKKKEVKQMIHSLVPKAELKYKEFSDFGTIPNVAQLDNCLQITQGTTALTRIGDEVQLSSIYYRLNFVLADVYNFIRVIFFQWFDVSTPTASSILQDPSSGVMSLIVRDYTAEQNLRVLSDKVYTLTNNNDAIFADGYLSGFKKKVVYQTGSTSAGSGLIYMLIVSDSTATTHPSWTLNMRSKFSDS